MRCMGIFSFFSWRPPSCSPLALLHHSTKLAAARDRKKPLVLPFSMHLQADFLCVCFAPYMALLRCPAFVTGGIHSKVFFVATVVVMHKASRSG